MSERIVWYGEKPPHIKWPELSEVKCSGCIVKETPRRNTQVERPGFFPTQEEKNLSFSISTTIWSLLKLDDGEGLLYILFPTFLHTLEIFHSQMCLKASWISLLTRWLNKHSALQLAVLMQGRPGLSKVFNLSFPLFTKRIKTKRHRWVTLMETLHVYIPQKWLALCYTTKWVERMHTYCRPFIWNRAGSFPFCERD